MGVIDNRGYKNPNYRHGGNTINRPEYNSWRAMMARCNDPKYWAYRRYGGRGITVCERWRVFSSFLEDMGKKPTPKHSLDRIDGDKDYSPENCQWATQRHQMSHTSRTRLETIDGETRTLQQWCEHFGKKRGQIYNRLREGWSVEKALKTPINPNGVNFR